MQKKYFLLTTAMLVTISMSAQIAFVADLTFEEIKEKAKKENKLIFLDIYTTWCVPCKKMDVEVYPDKAVGDYFNSRFISVKSQMDRTPNDNAAVQKWEPTARQLEQDYPIAGYPTFLFLSSDGRLVHHTSGARSAADFIKEARYAVEPARKEEDRKAASFYSGGFENFLRTYPHWKAIQSRIEEAKVGTGEEWLLTRIINYYTNGIVAGDAEQNVQAAYHALEQKIPTGTHNRNKNCSSSGRRSN